MLSIRNKKVVLQMLKYIHGLDGNISENSDQVKKSNHTPKE